MFGQYDMKFATHNSLKHELGQLENQMYYVNQNLSKEKVLEILNLKARAADMSSHSIEKKFLKEELDMKAFMSSYIKERSEYHKY